VFPDEDPNRPCSQCIRSKIVCGPKLSAKEFRESCDKRTTVKQLSSVDDSPSSRGLCDSQITPKDIVLPLSDQAIAPNEAHSLAQWLSSELKYPFSGLEITRINQSFACGESWFLVKWQRCSKIFCTSDYYHCKKSLGNSQAQGNNPDGVKGTFRCRRCLESKIKVSETFDLNVNKQCVFSIDDPAQSCIHCSKKKKGESCGPKLSMRRFKELTDNDVRNPFKVESLSSILKTVS
jgi:hypothetical protein